MSYTLPELGYAYDALEPHFDAQTMEIHHTKHHQAYVNNANAVLETLPAEFSEMCSGQLISQLDKIPAEKRTALRNNAGGHANHSVTFYQTTLCKQCKLHFLKCAPHFDLDKIPATTALPQAVKPQLILIGNYVTTLKCAEPHFDAQTMEIHHSKHHQAYVNNANAVLETLPAEFSEMCAGQLISQLDKIPAEKRTALRNNAGGHANHSLFWKSLKKAPLYKVI